MLGSAQEAASDELLVTLVRSAYMLLGRSEARLLLIQLEDLALQRSPVNTPGTFHEMPNWRHRLAIAVDALVGDERVRVLADAVIRDKAKMKAVVMAGGEGSRLRPLTSRTPKPLVPIANKPVMQHIIELLRAHGITEVVASVHYLADEIESYFGDGSAFGVSINYVVEDTPLGTAGAVKLAQEWLNEDFLVISGDVMTDCDIAALVQQHRSQGNDATIALVRVPNPLEFGVVITEDDGRISRFLEKPSWGEVFSDTINTGIYVLASERSRSHGTRRRLRLLA